METKLNRIAAFIDSLPEESMVGDSRSMVLTSHLEVIGGGDVTVNELNCLNKGTGCFGSENQKGCENRGFCGLTTNKAGCVVVDPSPNSGC